MFANTIFTYLELYIYIYYVQYDKDNLCFGCTYQKLEKKENKTDALALRLFLLWLLNNLTVPYHRF